MLQQRRFVPKFAVSIDFGPLSCPTHRSLAIGETALEGGNDHILMLLLDDLWCSREYPEGVLALGWVLRLTRLEEGAQKLWPCEAYSRQYAFWSLHPWESSPSSVCCRANSATASPTLLRTELSVSLARQVSNFARIASRSGSPRVRKRSCVWPLAALRGFEDWRLKMTAANVRV
jgi:hypothetical protein